VILIVDDDARLRLAFSAVLEGAGYEVEEAYCGKVAAGMLDNGCRPALIVSDLKMPHGVEFITDWLASHPEVKAPVIALTGYVQSLKAELLDRGAIAGVLEKPIAGNKLLELAVKYDRPVSKGGGLT
jgi:CheY-like chemotaxis protein